MNSFRSCIAFLSLTLVLVFSSCGKDKDGDRAKAAASDNKSNLSDQAKTPDSLRAPEDQLATEDLIFVVDVTETLVRVSWQRDGLERLDKKLDSLSVTKSNDKLKQLISLLRNYRLSVSSYLMQNSLLMSEIARTTLELKSELAQSMIDILLKAMRKEPTPGNPTIPSFKDAYAQLNDSEKELKNLHLIFQEDKSSGVTLIIWEPQALQLRLSEDQRLNKTDKKNVYLAARENLDKYATSVEVLTKNYPTKLSSTETASFLARASFAKLQREKFQKEIQE